jgi:fibronectin-binding autotransporter adhesin
MGDLAIPTESLLTAGPVLISFGNRVIGGGWEINPMSLLGISCDQCSLWGGLHCDAGIAVWGSDRRGSYLRVAVAAVALAAGSASAADSAWSSATTGGLWSDSGNWTTGVPGSGDTATLGNATADRTVTYDASAPTSLGTLDFDQSSAFLNELVVQRGFTLTNALTLGGSGGTERLYLLPAVASTFTLTASGGITVNTGGELLLGAFNPSGGTNTGIANLTGNVTVGGGLFDAAALVREGVNTGNILNTLTGTLTMTSGTLRVSNPSSSTIQDRRLTVTGDISISGGTVATDRVGSQIQANGTANTLEPDSYDTALVWSFNRNGDQSLTTSVPLGKVLNRAGVKTLTSTETNGTVGIITFIDNSTTGTVGTTLRLGSNLSSVSLPAAETFSQTTTPDGRVDYGFDLQNFTLDLSGAPTGWTPNRGAVSSGTPISNAVWTLTGDGGRIRAPSFNLSISAVSTEIGPGVILEATGGNGTANTLTSGGTIDVSAIFRYAGTASVASPATLTSTRAVPTIEVTSGALQISSLTNVDTVAVSVGNGGTLLVPNAIDDTAAGNLLGGTYAAGSAFGFNTAAGSRTYEDAITGVVGLAKAGANTLTLSGDNDYTGDTVIAAGTLALNRPDGNSYAGVISGAGSLTLTNAGTLTLSGASTYGGATSLAGSLVLSGGDNRLPTTTTLNFTGASSTIDVGGNSQSLATFTTPNGLAASYTVTGTGGALAVGSGAAVLQIGPGGAVVGGDAVALDLSGLGTFTYTNTGAGTGLRVGLKSGSNNSGALGQVATLTLAASNTITTNAIFVGDGGAGTSGGTSTLRLGQASTLNTALINVGNSGRSNANFEFASGLTDPTATIRGLNGTEALPLWLVGNVANFGASTWTANVNLSGGSVDALVTEMFVGNASIGTQTGRAGTQNSTVTMGAGTLAVGTLTLGRIDGSAASGVSATLAANGTLTIGTAGGQVVADTVELARNTYLGGTTHARTVSGTINLTAGTLAATSITRGPQTGNATATTAFNWTAGTLTHKAGTDLTVATVPITLAAGTSTFEAAAGRTITLDSGSPLAGTGGFTKAGDGLLLLESASTYSGTANIAGGTLRLAGGTNRLPTASSVAFTAGGTTFDVGTTTQTLAALVTPSTGTTSVAVIGGGSLTVNGAQSFEVGAGGSGVTVAAGSAVDLSLASLGTFIYDNSAFTFRVGTKSGSAAGINAGPGTSALTLAAANTITAGTLGLADTALSDNAGGATLQLGTANALNVGTITQAFSRADTSIAFAGGLTNPAATIRGVTGGTSAVGSWTVGNVAQFAGASKQSFTSTADFSAGSLDAVVDALVVGQAATSGQLNRAGTQNSAFTMGAGTLAVSTLTVGRITGGGEVGGTYAANGTLTIGTAGSLVEAGSLLLAENTLTATGAFSKTVSGTVSLSAGTLRAGRIALGDQTGGTATPATTFTWTGGTIENLAGGDLAVETLPLTLASGTGTFHATGSRTITVDAASPISGGGALAKTGPGALVLAAANTFSGGTTVAAGRLAVDGSLAGGVTVAAGAEFGGSGSIAGRISGAGTVAPGNSPGITTAADLDPTGGLGFAFEFTAPGDPTWSNAAASVNDVLRLTAGTPFTAPLGSSNAVDVYFDVASFGGSAAFRGGFFTDAAADFLATIQAADFTYYVRGDGQGPTSYNGVNYYELSAWDPAYSVSVSTPTVALADFAGGTVTNGRVTEFVVVPEPGTTAGLAALTAALAAWRAARRRGGA